MERAMVISSTLETLPTHIVTSPLASLRLVRSFCFKSPIIATEPVSNTHVLPGVLVRYTLITRIYFVEVASLLIYQVSRVILLQWLFPLLQKHLVSGLGSTLGFFTRAAADLPFHEASLLPLPSLKLVVSQTINN